MACTKLWELYALLHVKNNIATGALITTTNFNVKRLEYKYRCTNHNTTIDE